jgi:hypothetical protein
VPYTDIKAVLNDATIALTRKDGVVLWNFYTADIQPDDLKGYLESYPEKDTTSYKFLLCAYDYFLYGGDNARETIDATPE